MPNHKMPPAQAQGGRLLWVLGISVLTLAISGVIALWLTVRHFQQDLPSVAAIRTVELGEPMRVMSAEGLLMAEFGTERRLAVRFDEIPPRVIEAFLAAEDERFMQHRGVDPVGLIRASVRLLQTGERAQGGSTITMQLARNVFLSSERTYTRKIREILLALQIEEELSKEEILELYLNKIFLGERAYGVAAAAQVYFNRPLSEITVDQAALIAGLPKAPSRDNPIANPARALDRRNYVLRRMHASGFINASTLSAAQASPLGVSPYRAALEVEAPYAAEMARQEVLAALGEVAYSQGLRVITTVVAKEQTAAVDAVRNGLLDVEMRQGWRGVEATLNAEVMNDPEALMLALTELRSWPALTTALITGRSGDNLQAENVDGERLELDAAAIAWAGPQKDQLKPGAVIRLRRNKDGALRLSQTPAPQAAFVALDPQTGAITSMVGGYDFYLSSFNRSVQAQRQIGSAFKPFLYAAAMDAGFTPASVVLDAPVVFDDPMLEEAWRPTNYSGRFYGPTRLRDALVHSRNLVTVRLLQAIGFEQSRSYAQKFGLDRNRLPRDLTMALGSAVYTPLELATAYAVLANGGLKVTPHLIDRVETADGTVVWRPGQALTLERMAPIVVTPTPTPPPESLSDVVSDDSTGLEDPRRVVSEAVAWLITDILRDAVRRGTGARVTTELRRRDLAGKTGTTNDETDAWFAGYNRHRVGVAWVGHDQPQRIGRGEVGGRAALPIWVDVMRVALEGVADDFPAPPASVMSVRIDPNTGERAGGGTPNSVFEFVPVDSRERGGQDQMRDDAPSQGHLPPSRPREGPALDDLF